MAIIQIFRCTRLKLRLIKTKSEIQEFFIEYCKANLSKIKRTIIAFSWVLTFDL